MTTTRTAAAARAPAPPPGRRPAAPAAEALLSLALAVVAGAAALLSLLDDGLLRGPAAMAGSARGTALVTLVLGLPLLVGSVVATARGSALATLTWLGALGFLLYNALMFLFATPVNSAFPLYVAWLALTAWSVGVLLARLDVTDLGSRFDRAGPWRGVAAYIWVVAALNAAAWLARIVPAVAGGTPADLVRGTGVQTSIVYVQDLALWLPFLAVVAGWLRRGRPWGLVLGTAGLVMWVLESVSIAVDQAYGAAADPRSAVVSGALVPVFLVLAAIGTVPVLVLLRGFDGEGLRAKAARVAPTPQRRTSAAWALAGTGVLVGMFAVFGGVALARDGFGMPDGWLAATPFHRWLLPGLSLLVGVALPQLAMVALLVGGSSWARLGGALAGALLVAWIVVQVLVLQRLFFLQPVVAVLGVAELALALSWARWPAPTRPVRRTARG